MSVEIKVPSVGESITEGILSRWLKKDGDAVRSGEPLFELETEKATTEVPSPVDGVLSISTKEGSTVAIGSVVGHVDPQGKPKAEARPATPPPKVEKNEKHDSDKEERAPAEVLLTPSAR